MKKSIKQMHLYMQLIVIMVLAAVAPTAFSQTYPNKQIQFVVAFTAGSATDIIARAMADVISKNEIDWAKMTL
jgi:tripartite-type tricarboxylate transporter receptor subunit TctC